MPQRQLVRRRKAVSAAIAIVGVTLSALAGWWVDRGYERLRDQQVASRTDQAVTAVKVGLDRVAISVRAVRGMYAAGVVTQEEFRRFAETLSSSQGFRSLGFFRRVPADMRVDYERRFTTEPAKSLGIWEYGPDGKPVRAPDRPEYYVVEAAYLVDGRDPVYGYNALSQPDRANAINASISSGELVASIPLTLINTDKTGIVFYAPAFDRTGQIIGLATSSIDLDSLSTLAERTSGVPGISITVGRPDQPIELESTVEDATPGRDTFEFAKQTWTIDTGDMPLGELRFVRWIPLLLLGAGLALTFAVLGYIASAGKTKQINIATAQLRGMLDGLGPLAWLLTPSGAVISANRTATEMLKHSEQEMVERPFWDLPMTISPSDRTKLRRGVESARAGEDTRFDLSVDIGGSPRIFDLWVHRLSNDPRVSNLVASAVDVTERHQAQETQRLLMRELDHRMKNTLQVIQAIIRRTAKSHMSIVTFEQSLLGRIRAMSRAHELLAGERWLGADIDTIVRQETGSFDIGGVIRISGPHVRLNPKAALSLALAIHELGTNAAKYGGLSSPTGSVDISWSVEQIEDRPWLVLRWQEAGGPPVEPPGERGFGSLLIERSIAYELGGDARMEFLSSGLACSIKVPLETIRPFGHDRPNNAWGVSRD